MRGARSPWRHGDIHSRSIDVRADAPAAPSRWELLLAELDMSEDEAAALMRSGIAHLTPLGRRIERWVRDRARYAFVPEAILAACGIREDELGLLQGVPRRQRPPGRVRPVGESARAGARLA